MKVVLDTNVLVSGLLNPYGAPGSVLRLVAAGLVTVCHDARILGEYEAVLLRATFGFRPAEVRDLLALIRTDGEAALAKPLGHALPDPSDAPFLEVAVAARAACLVTGNARHYPFRARNRVRVLAPGPFLAFFATSR
ncbi:MAG TPA: putative toxin-antitoxin system toxin component, PIN family [Kiritimatiellia bacterium]